MLDNFEWKPNNENYCYSSLITESIRAGEQHGVDKKNIEEYVIDINNKLFELCKLLKLDINSISNIDKKNYQSNPFNDEQKKAIISSIKLQEEIAHEEAKKNARDEAMKAAGISAEETSVDESISNFRRTTLSQINSDFEIERAKSIMKRLQEKENPTIQDNKKNIEDLKDKFKSRVIKSGHGLAPPKTDWKRVDISSDERNKIIESIRANPKSNVFSKDFNWNPKDFLGAFSYLEESSEYNGPFIVSVVSDKDELKKYSSIPNISDGVSKICVGKFVLLSIYDITASSKEAKYIYMGLNYIGMKGELELSSIGSTTGYVTTSQKKIAMEYMDAMGIAYDENNKDLKML